MPDLVRGRLPQPGQRQLLYGGQAFDLVRAAVRGEEGFAEGADLVDALGAEPDPGVQHLAGARIGQPLPERRAAPRPVHPHHAVDARFVGVESSPPGSTR
ncbi:hypothetical protein OG562_43025 [Streptomyces sp. NBC_01275]|uniref:hypothetical protein n=1 Tax=Streptomyces sp. NBC_01275 TaxID=2903807 RepID=UPI0022549085|nr:hypothetical protein [Streptomyces sp. NBC_01275]MCX4767615.1 hypothetical protein [Streptomyces sp. NBC_01275]